MTEKLKILLRCILFFIVFVLLLSILSLIFLPKNNLEAFGISSQEVKASGILGENEYTIDTIFIGDSEAMAAFSPMELWDTHGITSYNCGTSGQTLNTAYNFLLKAFKQQSPKVVVLETNTIYRSLSTDTFLSSCAEIIMPIFKYHNRWKSLNANDVSLNFNYTSTDDLKGYNQNAAVAAASTDNYMTPSEAIRDIPASSLFFLKQIKTLCQSNDAELILVSTPSTLNWNYANHNGIEAFAKEQNLKYIDMNLMPDQLSINWNTDTRDKGDHLNDNGAKKVSRWLADYLTEIYDFVDHRSDSHYSSWNVALSRYRQLVAK